MTTLQLEQASDADILKILRQTRAIWSGGLRPNHFIQYIYRQKTHPWARKHLQYLQLKDGAESVASLKFYSRSYLSRGKKYRLAGLGAVYTMDQFRGKGYGTELIRHCIKLAEEKEFDGLLLSSDIDPEFYRRLGFVDLGGCNFEQSIEVEKQKNNFKPKYMCQLTLAHIPALSLVYNRHLRERPYIQLRSTQFWSFKLTEQFYFQKYSPSEWPGFTLITLTNPTEGFQEYAIVENSSKYLRVLELFGRPDKRIELWREIEKLAQSLGCQCVRGFEGVDPPVSKNLSWVERDWGRPMILPISKAVESWLDADPCPLLELDHF